MTFGLFLPSWPIPTAEDSVYKEKSDVIVI